MADSGKIQSSILPGCNVLNSRVGINHHVKHIQKASQSPLDLESLTAAIAVLIEKNDIWSGRSGVAGYAVRAGIDETVSSHDRCGLKMFCCDEDAIEDVAEYAKKICQESGMSEACLVLAVIYTDRIQHHVSLCFEETFLLQKSTVRRLLLVSSFIASKIYDVDAPEDMWRISKWAAIGGISPDNLRSLEQSFLDHSLQFSLYVHWQEFEFKRAVMEELSKAAQPARARPGATADPILPAGGAPTVSAAAVMAAAEAIDSVVLGDDGSGGPLDFLVPTAPAGDWGAAGSIRRAGADRMRRAG
jgi:hypothetical protein